jgi:hypothetical protein
MEVSGQFHTSIALQPPKKESLVPVGGPQSRSGHGGEGKNFQPLPGLEPPITQSAAQLNTTPRRSILCLITHYSIKMYGGKDA